jgi:hypothetical protein
MRPGFVGSYGLGPGRPAKRADTRENPVGKNGVMTGPSWLYGEFGGKIVADENFTQFCLKSPLEFVFTKNTFSV